jgi:hypothetical protein
MGLDAVDVGIELRRDRQVHDRRGRAAGVLGIDRGRTGGTYAPAGVRGSDESVFVRRARDRARPGSGRLTRRTSRRTRLPSASSGSPPANWAVYGGGNIGASGTKSFVEPHPTDPSKVIRTSRSRVRRRNVLSAGGPGSRRLRDDRGARGFPDGDRRRGTLHPVTRSGRWRRWP